MNSNNKKIVVTGASGFIGQHAMKTLTDRGFEVFGLSRTADKSKNIYACDLLNASNETLDNLFKEIQPTHLLHLAWCVTPGEFWTSPQNHDWAEASIRLYDSFKSAGGKRFVGSGTCAEYSWDDLTHETVLHEYNTLIKPSTLYGETKAKLFKTITEKSSYDNVSFAWGRIFFLYGIGEKRKRLISDVICSLLNGKEVETTAGTQIRDFMDVRDVAGAFASLCDSKTQGAVNIGSGDIFTLADILKEIETQIGTEGLLKLGARPMRENDPPALIADIMRLKTEVGFTPQYNIQQGIANAIAYWKTQL